MEKQNKLDLSLCKAIVDNFNDDLKQAYNSTISSFEQEIEMYAHLVTKSTLCLFKNRKSDVITKVEEQLGKLEKTFSERMSEVNRYVFSVIEDYLSKVQETESSESDDDLADEYQVPAKPVETIKKSKGRKSNVSFMPMDVDMPSTTDVRHSSQGSRPRMSRKSQNLSYVDVVPGSPVKPPALVNKKRVSTKSNLSSVNIDLDESPERRMQRRGTDLLSPTRIANIYPDVEPRSPEQKPKKRRAGVSSPAEVGNVLPAKRTRKSLPASAFSSKKEQDSGSLGTGIGMSPWCLLNDISNNVPDQPAVYEIKVKQAKKCAFIGSCENLKERLLGHKSGDLAVQKNLDKFIRRNAENVEVRFLILPSLNYALKEANSNLKHFQESYGKLPVYNDE